MKMQFISDYTESSFESKLRNTVSSINSDDFVSVEYAIIRDEYDRKNTIKYTAIVLSKK